MPSSERCHTWRGTDPGYFIYFGPAGFYSSTILRVTAQRQHVFPRYFKSSQSQVSIYLPSFPSVALRPSSFSPKVKRFCCTVQECNNTGFSWSGYCACLPGFKLLLERHFRGHHSVVSEREPDVVPRGSMSA